MVWQPHKDKMIYNLNIALDIVREKLIKADIERQCLNSGAVRIDSVHIIISYLNQKYMINTAGVEVLPLDDAPILSVHDIILILHYFTQAKGTPLTGKPITFRDLPGGIVYYPNFIKRAILPLVNTFGKNADLLKKSGESFNACRGGIGDTSFIIDVLPRVPVTVILWQGDDELIPEVNLLFDGNILDYLESEDVTIACEALTWRLIHTVKKA